MRNPFTTGSCATPSILCKACNEEAISEEDLGFGINKELFEYCHCSGKGKNSYKVIKKCLYGKCEECGEKRELKKDVYDNYFCDECIEIKQDEGFYNKMD